MEEKDPLLEADIEKIERIGVSQMMEQSFENSEDLIRMRQLLSDQKENLELGQKQKTQELAERVFDDLPPPVIKSKKLKAAMPKLPPRNDFFRSQEDKEML